MASIKLVIVVAGVTITIYLSQPLILALLALAGRL
jgi:hypothetical protein